MSIDKIFGSWNKPPTVGSHDELSQLWHKLAGQHEGTPQQQNNSGLTQRRSEIVPLWELYLRARPKVVVEIGVAQGGTWAAWCYLGQHDATIIGIDRCVDDCRPRNGDPCHYDIAPPTNMSTMQGGGMHAHKKGNQRIVAINGWSTEESTLNQLNNVLDGRKIDWLWCDSSHQEEKFRVEFPMYFPLVAEGGVYCTHDVQESSHPDVTKWKEWRKIKASFDYSACFEFLGGKDADSYGIGVIIK